MNQYMPAIENGNFKESNEWEIEKTRPHHKPNG